MVAIFLRKATISLGFIAHKSLSFLNSQDDNEIMKSIYECKGSGLGKSDKTFFIIKN